MTESNRERPEILKAAVAFAATLTDELLPNEPGTLIVSAKRTILSHPKRTNVHHRWRADGRDSKPIDDERTDVLIARFLRPTIEKMEERLDSLPLRIEVRPGSVLVHMSKNRLLVAGTGPTTRPPTDDLERTVADPSERAEITRLVLELCEKLPDLGEETLLSGKEDATHSAHDRLALLDRIGQTKLRLRELLGDAVEEKVDRNYADDAEDWTLTLRRVDDVALLLLGADVSEPIDDDDDAGTGPGGIRPLGGNVLIDVLVAAPIQKRDAP
jgi:hypothetical protein